MYTVEDSKLIVFGDHPDFKECPEIEETTSTSRWHVQKFSVYAHETDGTYWAITWNKAATERQEHEFWNAPYQVKKGTRVVVAWDAV